MEEIAVEAGVSKPTLYSTFRNKDEALASTIRLAKYTAIEAIREAWKHATTLEEKLDILFDRLVLAGYDMLHNAPDADAFENSIGEASAMAIAETRKLEAELLTEALAYCSGLEVHGTTPEQYATFVTFVVTAAMQAKRQSKSRSELMMFLDGLKLSALSVTSSG